MAALVFHPPRAKGKARAVEEPEEEWRNLAGGEAEARSPPITAQMPSNERRRVLCPGPVPHRRLHSFAGGEAEAESPPITAQMPSNERRRVLCPGPVPHRRLHSCQLPPSWGPSSDASKGKERKGTKSSTAEPHRRA